MTSVRESTISALQSSRITRHEGRPTRQAVKATRLEIAMKYAAAKTTHLDFPYGTRFGFAAAILTPSQYITKHNAACVPGEELDAAWVFDAPEKP